MDVLVRIWQLVEDWNIRDLICRVLSKIGKWIWELSVYDKLMIKQNCNSMEVAVGCHSCTEGPYFASSTCWPMVDVAGIPQNSLISSGVLDGEVEGTSIPLVQAVSMLLRTCRSLLTICFLFHWLAWTENLHWLTFLCMIVTLLRPCWGRRPSVRPYHRSWAWNDFPWRLTLHFTKTCLTKKTKLRGLSLEANYTDRAIGAYRRS
jgi:hypothetical protein